MDAMRGFTDCLPGAQVKGAILWLRRLPEGRGAGDEGASGGVSGRKARLNHPAEDGPPPAAGIAAQPAPLGSESLVTKWFILRNERKLLRLRRKGYNSFRRKDRNLPVRPLATIDFLNSERMFCMEFATLNNGVKMPMAGIGTFLLSPDEAEASVLSASSAATASSTPPTPM